MRVFLAFLVCLVISGCKPSETATSLRAAVVLVAEGVKAADEVCANVAQSRKDVDLAIKCAESYDLARPFLLAAEMALDASQTNDAACSLSNAVQALFRFQLTLSHVGIPLPAISRDALSFAAGLSGLCHA